MGNLPRRLQLQFTHMSYSQHYPESEHGFLVKDCVRYDAKTTTVAPVSSVKVVNCPLIQLILTVALMGVYKHWCLLLCLRKSGGRVSRMNIAFLALLKECIVSRYVLLLMPPLT